MATDEANQSTESVNVLLIGNNPIELSSILSTLNQINGARVITEVAFDLKTILQRLMTFKPNYILIDDNIGRAELSQTIETLGRNADTKNIPIAVLKNSNYEEAYHSKTLLDFLLKNNISPERIYRTLRNALRFRKMESYLRTSLREPQMEPQI